jgi:GTP-binding protein
VLLLLDATQGVTDQDAHIAGYILESGRAVVLAVNKWDAVDDYQREQCSARSKPGWPSSSSPPALHLGDQAPGPGPGLEAIAQAHQSAMVKMPRRC